MRGAKARAMITKIQDKLIALYVYRKEASAAGNWPRVRALQTEIDRLKARLALIRGGKTVALA
jgi:hypothetical protein